VPPQHVGQPTTRIEDARLVTGAARWTDSLPAAGALHLGVARAPLPHGRIRRVDVAAARAAPGVVAAYTAADLASLWHAPLPARNLRGLFVPDRWPLATDRVRHSGMGVAAVVAATRAAASDALEHIDVDYEPLPAVPNIASALAAGTLVHDEAPGNVAFRYEGKPSGDLDAALAAADVVLERRYVQQRLVPAPLETRAVLAVPDPLGGVTLYTSTQVPHTVREHLARCLGRDEREVRVVAPDVGGAFGAKLNVYPEELLCAGLALHLGRPVRWAATRSEDVQTTNHGRGQVQDITVAARADGTLLGLRVHVTADCGGYLLDDTVGTPMSGRRMFPGCYRWPAYHFTLTGVYTTATPTDAYRGAGRPEATFGVERALDDLAAALRLDPADLRRRNFPAPEEFPFANAGGYTYDSGDYEPALDAALTAVDYKAVRAEQADRRASGATRLLGIGLSSYVEVCGFGPGDPELGAVSVRDDGAVEVRSGLAPSGQGTATSLAQIVADELGVAPAAVTVVFGDTALVPVGSGTSGSRSMPVGAPAVLLAARAVADKARRVAAHLLEAAPDDVVIADGRFGVRGSPDAAVSLAQVAAAAGDGDVPADLAPGLEASTRYQPHGLTFPFGTHACVVEVDTETGAVALLRFVAVDDVGSVVNPLLLDGQRHGGIAQGIAQALYEGVVYDADGNLQTATLTDYLAPTAPDLPAFELARTTTPSPHNPLGVKGAGEAGAIGAPPAVVNAVVDAVRHLGVDDVEMPCTPRRVWAALRAATP
jgi:aerobic carbon-monoxide dehydrogenase large subunit